MNYFLEIITMENVRVDFSPALQEMRALSCLLSRLTVLLCFQRLTLTSDDINCDKEVNFLYILRKGRLLARICADVF